MCIVSMVMTEGQKLWPLTQPYQDPFYPVGPLVPFDFDAEVLKTYIEMLGAAKTLDKQTNQPDCESPEKLEWFDAFLVQIRAHAVKLIEDNVSEGAELIKLAKQMEQIVKP